MDSQPADHFLDCLLILHVTLAAPTIDAPARQPTSMVPAPLVLHVRVVSESGGGPEKTILNSPRYLPDLGYRAECAYLYPSDDPGFEAIRERAAKAEAPLNSLPDRGAFDFGVVRSLVRLCRERNVQIWHAHDYKTNAIGLLVRRFHPMKLVTTVHGWVKHTKRTPIYYWIDRRCLPWYDRVICVSEDLRDVALKAGVRPERCVVIDNAIETADYERTLSPADARRQLGLPVDVPLVGSVGRLSEEKGYHHLVDAVARLHDAGNPVHLAIAGNGDARPALERQIQEQRFPERFHLLGYQPDPRVVYQAIDVFALSSHREGLPNVLLEAMSSRLPVVATTVGGVPNLMTHNETGLLVSPGDVPTLAAALESLIGNTEWKQQLADSAYQLVEARYSFRRRMEKVAAVYNQLS